MPTVTIRNLDADVKSALQRRAAAHGRSMESEIRDVLSRSVADEAPSSGIGSRIRAMFAGLDGMDIPKRTSDEARAVEFS